MLGLRALESGDLLLRIKTTLANALGYLGLSIAVYADSILFYEANWFKALVALTGLILGMMTIYSIFLDVKIKKKKIEGEE